MDKVHYPRVLHRCPQVARADKILTIDASPDYPVLNLGQSASVVAYELYQGRMVEGRDGGRPGGEEREGQQSGTRPTLEMKATRGDSKGAMAVSSGGSQEPCTKAGCKTVRDKCINRL